MNFSITTLAHGDETSWRVHARGEEGENPRSWLRVCQTAVRMVVDPSRSAAAAQKLLGGLGVDEPAALRLQKAGQGVVESLRAGVRRDFVNSDARGLG